MKEMVYIQHGSENEEENVKKKKSNIPERKNYGAEL